jgi:hypothetical protein
MNLLELAHIRKPEHENEPQSTKLRSRRRSFAAGILFVSGIAAVATGCDQSVIPNYSTPEYNQTLIKQLAGLALLESDQKYIRNIVVGTDNLIYLDQINANNGINVRISPNLDYSWTIAGTVPAGTQIGNGILEDQGSGNIVLGVDCGTLPIDNTVYQNAPYINPGDACYIAGKFIFSNDLPDHPLSLMLKTTPNSTETPNITNAPKPTHKPKK